jgi:hypothetical protein
MLTERCVGSALHALSGTRMAFGPFFSRHGALYQTVAANLRDSHASLDDAQLQSSL